jgi:2-iminobutanoate/2-iminopropanoate deaminase
MKITHLNPDALFKSPAFSQAVSVEGAARTIYVGGQNGITANGELAGDDLSSQTEQALRNVLEALRAGGASQANVVKLTIYIVEGQDVNVGYAASQKIWGSQPTAISAAIVAGLGVPGALVEIDAVAVNDS